MFDVFEALRKRAANKAGQIDELDMKKEKAAKELKEARAQASRAIASGDADAYAKAEENARRLELFIEGCVKIATNCDKRLSFDEASVMWSEHMKTYNPTMQKKLKEYTELKQKLFDKYIECAKYQNQALHIRTALSCEMEPSGRYNIDNTAGFEQMIFIDNDNSVAFFKDDTNRYSYNWDAIDTCTNRRFYTPELDK